MPRIDLGIVDLMVAKARNAPSERSGFMVGTHDERRPDGELWRRFVTLDADTADSLLAVVRAALAVDVPIVEQTSMGAYNAPDHCACLHCGARSLGYWNLVHKPDCSGVHLAEALRPFRDEADHA